MSRVKRLAGANARHTVAITAATEHFTAILAEHLLAHPQPHDGALLRLSTWRSALGFFFGRDGLVRHTFGPWRAYFRPDFHPSQLGGQRGVQWLEAHEAQFAVVGRAPT